MLKNIIAVLILVIIGVLTPISALSQQRIIIAQNNSPTLWDLLFGPQKKKSAPSQQTRKIPKRTVPRATPNIITLQSVPKITKSAEATRLMVFGDSLAVDLAKGLQRFYAQDENLIIIDKGVGSSGFVRDDFYDWSAALKKEIEADSFDIGVIFMGINDKQPLLVNGKSTKPLSEEWKEAYTLRLSNFLSQLANARKPTIMLGMPPMASPKYSASIVQISSLQRLAAFANGIEFVDIYERFANENGKYTSSGPDINGQQVLMRKSDGIHFSRAGSDKLAFFINQSLKKFYQGGTISLAITDPLEGTDAQPMQRPPLQGLGQLRLLEVAGAVMQLSKGALRADELLLIDSANKMKTRIDFNSLEKAPIGRVDAFIANEKTSDNSNEGTN